LFLTSTFKIINIYLQCPVDNNSFGFLSQFLNIRLILNQTAPKVESKPETKSKTIISTFGALLADIADDVLVLFGLDIMVTCSKMAALPVLIGCPSLKALNAKKDSGVHIPDESQFVVSLVAMVVLSDLLRIPDSYYPPAFHTALLQNFLTLRVDPPIQGLIAPVILDIVAKIGGMDPGSFRITCHSGRFCGAGRSGRVSRSLRRPTSGGCSSWT
jgi:hypothetical protein